LVSRFVAKDLFVPSSCLTMARLYWVCLCPFSPIVYSPVWSCHTLSYDPSSTARFMKETMALVYEIQRIEIGSHTYYHLTNRFSPDQVESKRKQYEARLN